MANGFATLTYQRYIHTFHECDIFGYFLVVLPFIVFVIGSVLISLYDLFHRAYYVIQIVINGAEHVCDAVTEPFHNWSVLLGGRVTRIDLLAYCVRGQFNKHNIMLMTNNYIIMLYNTVMCSAPLFTSGNITSALLHKLL